MPDIDLHGIQIDPLQRARNGDDVFIWILLLEFVNALE
jgi:hypothetical protein